MLFSVVVKAVAPIEKEDDGSELTARRGLPSANHRQGRYFLGAFQW